MEIGILTMIRDACPAGRAPEEALLHWGINRSLINHLSIKSRKILRFGLSRGASQRQNPRRQQVADATESAGLTVFCFPGCVASHQGSGP